MASEQVERRVKFLMDVLKISEVRAREMVAIEMGEIGGDTFVVEEDGRVVSEEGSGI